MALAVTYEDFLPRLVKIIKSPDKDDLKGDGYVEACKHAKEMGVHLNGDRPDDLLNRVRPREDPQITAYRLASYEPTTKSRADKGVSLTSKIFHPKLSAIKPANNKQGEQLYEYAMVEYPEYNSVFNYLSDYLLKKALADANALLVVEPKVPYRVDGEDIVVDQTKQVMPFLNCYPSKDVYFFEDGIAIIFLYEEEEGEGTAKERYYYYKAVDQESITDFRIYLPNGTNPKVDELFTYQHKFHITPAWRTGGNYDQHHKGLFESFFYPAAPHWNKAINAESDLDGAFIQHIHPWRWEVAEECEFIEHSSSGRGYPCESGMIHNIDKDTHYICPSCNGAGRVSRRGPFGVSLVSKDKLSDPQGNNLSPDSVGGYKEVDTGPTALLDERVDKLEKKGFSALAMDIINEIGANQSGVAKEYDRTELHDFLGKVSTLFFDKHLKNIFYFFARYMFYNATPEQIKTYEPTIIKPNDFDILTTSELVEQLKVSKDSGVNPVYLRAKDIEIINKEFQSNPDVLKFMNLCVVLDPLAEISRTDIAQMVLDKSITQITAILHDNIQPFVRRALEEDKAFGDKAYMEQMEVLQGYAEETAEAIGEETKVSIDMMAFETEATTPPEPDPKEPAE